MKTPVKSARWSNIDPNDKSYVLVRTGFRTRKLRGAAAELLASKADHGRITFLPKMPKNLTGHLAIIGIPRGILVVIYTSSWADDMKLGLVKMCPTGRKLFGVSRAGKIRWARFRGVKS